MDWNDEAIARLRALWDEGHSTAEIGRRMGVTKNAIVGKAHRLELPARPSPIRRAADPAHVARRDQVRRATGPTLPATQASAAQPWTRILQPPRIRTRAWLPRPPVPPSSSAPSRRPVPPPASRPAAGPSASPARPASASATMAPCPTSPTARNTPPSHT